MTGKSFKNRLLGTVSPADLTSIKDALEPVALTLRQRIEPPNKPIQHIYFIEEGIVSIVATGPRGKTIEAGVIGFEGCTGLPFLLGAERSPLDTFVQLSGSALRIGVDTLRDAMDRHRGLQQILLRSAFAFTLQVAYTALSNGHATLDQRLARWLLMAHDRVRSPVVELTHEFLAIMLGVRRPGVTVALATLQAQGLVSLQRGAIIIQNRDGLLRLADRFYGAPEAEADRMLQGHP